MKNTYGFTKRVDCGFADAIVKTTEALKTEGFGVLTEIDMKKKLREKLGVEFREYVILGACNPSLAYQALQEELNLGLLLPCNVVVYEDAGGAVVAFIDAEKMMSVVENEKLSAVSAMVNEKLKRAMSNI